MQTKTSATNKYIFKISGWDQNDIVKETAEKMGLLVHTDFPEIQYNDETLELGLLDFHSAYTHNSYSSAILDEIELAKVNTTSKLASLLLFFKDQIPKEWRQYNLLTPGTTWISPDNIRGLTRMYFAEDKGGWNVSFQPIESFPVFKGCRFVVDCRDIIFPERTGKLK